MADEEIYGCDYSSEGFVSSTGDIGLVSELDNAKQSIRNQLLTRVGTYPSIDSDYGSECFDVLGEDKNNATMQALAVYVKEALLKQERVASIENIEPQITENGFKVLIHILLVNGTEEEMELDITGE